MEGVAEFAVRLRTRRRPAAAAQRNHGHLPGLRKVVRARPRPLNVVPLFGLVVRMRDTSVYVCAVKTPEGEKQYVTLLPPDIVFGKGLIPEAVVGVLLRPLGAGESFTPEAFGRNSVFVKFMHEIIAKDAPLEPGCGEEARRD